MVGCRLWCQVWVAISLFTSTRLCPCMPLDFLSSCRSVLHPRACERHSAVNPHELRVRCAQQCQELFRPRSTKADHPWEADNSIERQVELQVLY